jgi:hypothetical protein
MVYNRNVTARDQELWQREVTGEQFEQIKEPVMTG